ncbi:hypothetical protein POG22_11815 [Geitlerinema sp. CS-897]|nr:hypothetical protein [Geitlerinema sp. CS-897]
MDCPTVSCMLKSPSPLKASPKPHNAPATFSPSPTRKRTKERFLLYGAWAILVLSLIAMVATGSSSFDRSTSTPEMPSSESPAQP